MRRERHSLFALPVDKYFAEVNGKYPNIGQHPNNFSQLVMADPQQVSKMILGREQVELLGLLEELKNDPTVCYVEQVNRMTVFYSCNCGFFVSWRLTVGVRTGPCSGTRLLLATVLCVCAFSI